MSTRTTKATKATKMVKKAVSRGSQLKTTGRRASTRGRATKYAAPAAAVLGAGALTTAGVIMREELAEIAQRVLTEAMGATKNISLGKLLDFVGLQRRRSFLSTSLGGAGMLAAGVLSGAALIYWLAPARGEIPVRKSSLEMDGAQHHNSVSSSTDAFHAPV